MKIMTLEYRSLLETGGVIDKGARRGMLYIDTEIGVLPKYEKGSEGENYSKYVPLW